MTTLPTFKINNVTLPSPSNHHWILPNSKGINGNGVAIYEPYYSYELLWNYLSQSDYNTIFQTWLGTYNSGTSVINVPQINTSNYQFHEYSGVVVDIPTVGDYNENYLGNVKIMIRKIVI